ncbi:iron chaperone [Streptomyces sp. NPDC056160]|uniref:iron chaperone n=1 Tax=Streptomyces sp. NPDC056160 TaxID=3345731 RepID=UPI0035D81798
MGSAGSSAYEGFTAEERAAMKDHARELKTAARRRSRADKEAEAERDVLAKIAEMPEADRVMAERVHAVVTAAGAPVLAPKLWYGMPAYARDGKVVCFFQSAEKFKARYATLGFSDQANLDEGTMWPAGFALTEVTPEVETRIAALVKQAVS